MNRYLYNIGEIISREDERFWILPKYYVWDKEHHLCSPWFSCMGEKWRLVKVPSSFSLQFLIWRKGRSSLHKHKYTIQLRVETVSGFDCIMNGDTDSDYGCKLQNDAMKYNEIYIENGLAKLVFIIEKEEKESIGIASEMNIKETPTEDGNSSTDEESSEDETNSEDEDSSKRKTIGKAKDVQKLAENLKQVYHDGQMTDTVLKVSSREFNVHRVILVARSPVFASMFQHGYAEKNTNVVDIPDCTAESFEVFLHYLYTGSADTMSTNNVCNLYYSADKYHVDDLKKKCVKFMKNNLSAETFCDTIALSIRHGESKLQKAATSFFCTNIKKILNTPQWQNYMVENPTQANELLIKAHS